MAKLSGVASLDQETPPATVTASPPHATTAPWRSMSSGSKRARKFPGHITSVSCRWHLLATRRRLRRRSHPLSTLTVCASSSIVWETAPARACPNSRWARRSVLVSPRTGGYATKTLLLGSTLESFNAGLAPIAGGHLSRQFTFAGQRWTVKVTRGLRQTTPLPISVWVTAAQPLNVLPMSRALKLARWRKRKPVAASRPVMS